METFPKRYLEGGIAHSSFNGVGGFWEVGISQLLVKARSGQFFENVELRENVAPICLMTTAADRRPAG